MAAALGGCAILPGPATQVIEVLLDAQEPAWSGPLQCQASNAAGAWRFVAPGTVTVRISSPLWITCQVPPGALVVQSVSAAQPSPAARQAAQRGATVGAVAGGAGGLAAAIATAPVGAAWLGILLAAQSAWFGAQVGGAAASMGAGFPLGSYPDRIVVRIVRAPVDTAPPAQGRARQRPAG